MPSAVTVMPRLSPSDKMALAMAASLAERSTSRTNALSILMRSGGKRVMYASEE